MASTSEVGHAKNVANFEIVINYCIGYSTNYNPTNTNIKLANLQTFHADCKKALQDVFTTQQPVNAAIGARIATFSPLNTLSTRIVNALEASAPPAEAIKNAKTIARKIHGRRASATEETQPIDPNNPSPLADSQVSTSQQSYDNKEIHFLKLVELLQTVTEYTPNETTLQLTQLQAYLAQLQSTNSKVKAEIPALSNARIARNNLLYSDATGLIDRAKAIKQYVKSLYGASSPEYKQISGLKFVKVK